MGTDTRQAILAAALEAFDTAGFDRATVALVREMADVSNGSFFHFFPTKEALAGALFLDSLHSYHTAMISSLSPRSSAGDGIAMLLERHLDWVVSRRREARFLFEQVRADWLTTVRAEQRESNEEFRTAIERWREPLIGAGFLLPMPSQVFVAQLIGPAQILCRAWLSGRTTESPDKHAGSLISCTQRALLTPTAPRTRNRR